MHSLKITQSRETVCQADGTTTTLLWHTWGQKGSQKSGALRNRKQLFFQNATLQNLTQALRDRQGEAFQGISHYSQNTFLVQGPKQQLHLINSLLLLFWILQTCHARGQGYKMSFLPCQARRRRFHPVNCVVAAPRGSLTGLPKCSSCKSILLCHSTAWLTQLSPAAQKFGCSSHFGKAAPQPFLSHARRNGSVNPRWDVLRCSQNEASFKRPKAAL